MEYLFSDNDLARALFPLGTTVFILSVFLSYWAIGRFLEEQGGFSGTLDQLHHSALDSVRWGFLYWVMQPLIIVLFLATVASYAWSVFA